MTTALYGATSGRSTLNPAPVLLLPIFVTAALWMSNPNDVQPAAAVSAFLMLLIPWASFLVWKQQGRGGLPVFAMISAAYWVYFALPLFLGARTLPLNGRITTIHDDSLTLGVEMALLGVVSLWIGMRVPFTFGNSRSLPDIATSTVAWNYLHAVMITGTLIGASSVSWMAGGFRQILEIIGTIIPIVAFSILYRRYLKGEASTLEGMLLAGVVIVRVGLSLVAGWMGPAFNFGLTCTAVYIVERRRVPWKPILLAVALILFFQVGKASYRNTYWERQAGGSAIERISFWLEASATQWTSAFAGNSSSDARSLASATLERGSLLTQAAHVLDWTPSRVPFQNGATYEYLAVTLIPRMFWPDKPDLDDATRFYQLAYGLNDSKSVDSVSISVGSLAEAFINFGWIGVVVVMFGLGLVLRVCELTILASTSNSLLPAIGVTFLPGFMMIEHQLSQYLGGLLQQVLLTFVVFFPIITFRTFGRRFASRPPLSRIEDGEIRIVGK